MTGTDHTATPTDRVPAHDVGPSLRLPRFGPGGHRVAVIGDVLGNVVALDAVLEDIAGRGIARVWCVGGIVGAGIELAGPLRTIRQRCELVLASDVDRSLVNGASGDGTARTGDDELASWISRRMHRVCDARRSAGFDVTHREADALHALDDLAPGRIIAASSPEDGAHSLANVPPPLILVGGTRTQRVLVDSTQLIEIDQPVSIDPITWMEPDEVAELLDARRTASTRTRPLPAAPPPVVAHPGSVGAPLGDDPRPAWLELDAHACTVTMRRTHHG